MVFFCARDVFFLSQILFFSETRVFVRTVEKHLIGSDWWFGTFFIFPYIGNFIIPTD